MEGLLTDAIPSPSPIYWILLGHSILFRRAAQLPLNRPSVAVKPLTILHCLRTL